MPRTPKTGRNVSSARFETRTRQEHRDLARRHLERFRADNTRVISRYFGGGFGTDRVPVIESIMGMDADLARRELRRVRKRFSTRHFDLERDCLRHAGTLVAELRAEGAARLARRIEAAPSWRRELLGAYCTSEYAVAAAAFFNPSIVPHPDQRGTADGELRFVLSFRATGEGHISSLAFRTGTVDRANRFALAPVAPYLSTPEVVLDRRYDKKLVARKLQELQAWNATSGAVISALPAEFTRDEMEGAIASLGDPYVGQDRDVAVGTMRWLIDSNYSIRFPEGHGLDESLIFPVSPAEANGIEDARFVRFVDDDGEATYYATYTAYNGRHGSVQLIETDDFQAFHIRTLNGPAVRDKGMALFPRRIDGDYVMLGRQDGRRITIARSRHPHFWYEARELCAPEHPWELIKLGNCGSPIELDEGWLVITHGVGPMRRYCLGAILLDRDEPERVIGRLRRPLIEPTEDEREGYVPNVVYSCGSLRHGDHLILPYAMSDSASGLATVRIADLLARME